jgi:hypothetical protein
MAIDDMTNLASWERGRSTVLSFVDLNPMDQFFWAPPRGALLAHLAAYLLGG